MDVLKKPAIKTLDFFKSDFQFCRTFFSNTQLKGTVGLVVILFLWVCIVHTLPSLEELGIVVNADNQVGKQQGEICRYSNLSWRSLWPFGAIHKLCHRSFRDGLGGSKIVEKFMTYSCKKIEWWCVGAERGQKFRKKVVTSFMDGPSVVGTNDLWIHYRSLPFPPHTSSRWMFLELTFPTGRMKN